MDSSAEVIQGDLLSQATRILYLNKQMPEQRRHVLGKQEMTREVPIPSA